jgi:hypothetical protein
LAVNSPIPRDSKRSISAAVMTGAGTLVDRREHSPSSFAGIGDASRELIQAR